MLSQLWSDTCIILDCDWWRGVKTHTSPSSLCLPIGWINNISHQQSNTTQSDKNFVTIQVQVKSQKSKLRGTSSDFILLCHPPTYHHHNKNFSPQPNIQLSSNFHSRLTLKIQFQNSILDCDIVESNSSSISCIEICGPEGAMSLFRASNYIVSHSFIVITS